MDTQDTDVLAKLLAAVEKLTARMDKFDNTAAASTGPPGPPATVTPPASPNPVVPVVATGDDQVAIPNLAIVPGKKAAAKPTGKGILGMKTGFKRTHVNEEIDSSSMEDAAPKDEAAEQPNKLAKTSEDGNTAIGDDAEGGSASAVSSVPTDRRASALAKAKELQNRTADSNSTVSGDN